mgnify:FL=1
MQVDSDAGLVTKKFAGIRATQNELDAMLGAGAVRKNLGGVDVAIGPEEKTLSLTDNYVSLTFSNYENTPIGGIANPYQALHSLNSVRLGTNFA